MADKKQQPDATTTTGFPVKGIDVENPFDMQPPWTTPVGINVRACEPVTLRTRGGQRPGLVPYLPKLATGSVIQHLDFIVDPQADALAVDFEDDYLLAQGVDYFDDPSTNNLKTRNRGRRIRVGGSGRMSNINRPSITRQTPTINWSDPADISPGTPLSGTQLNATASVGILPITGTFKYIPPAGAVLPLGDNQALRVNFTPTDISLYKTATKTVHINVTSTPSPEMALVQQSSMTIFTGDPNTVSSNVFATDPVVAGNLLLVIIGTQDTQTLVAANVTDTAGNTFLSAGVVAESNGARVYIFYVKVTISGTAGYQISVNFGAGHGPGIIGMLEFSNPAASPLYDARPGDGTEAEGDPTMSPFTFNTEPVNFRGGGKHDLFLGVWATFATGTTDTAAVLVPGTGFTTSIDGEIDDNPAGDGELGLEVIWDVNPTIDSVIKRLTLLTGGSGYVANPDVVFTGGGGSGAAATATITGDAVTSLTLTNGGSGYTSMPTISFSPTAGEIGVVSATATAVATKTPTCTHTLSGLDYASYGISFKQV